MKTLRSSLQEKIAFLKLKSGDAEAFAFFYDKYVKNIYRFIYIKVANRQIAEDLTQDVFLKAWQHLVDKKKIKSFQAFVFRIARNSVVDHYRSNNNQELPLEYIGELEDITKSITSEIDKSMEAAALLEEIRKLKPEYQEVLILRYVEELSIDDISDVMQKDNNNVRVTLHRALSKLKQIIQEKNNRA